MPDDLAAAKTCVFANWHSIFIKQIVITVEVALKITRIQGLVG